MRVRNTAPTSDHFGQRSGCSDEQRAKRVLRLPQAALQLRNAGQRTQVLALGLLHVEFRVIATLEPPLGDLQAARLNCSVLASDLQTHLEGTNRRIQGRDLRRHQHLHIIVLRQTGKITGIGGLDTAPELAPQVEFPADTEAQPIAAEGTVRPTVLTLPDAQCVAAELLHLRVERAPGDTEIGARLENPQAGNAYIGVAAQRLVDQRIEHWVVEAAPPFGSDRR